MIETAQSLQYLRDIRCERWVNKWKSRHRNGSDVYDAEIRPALVQFMRVKFEVIQFLSQEVSRTYFHATP